MFHPPQQNNKNLFKGRNNKVSCPGWIVWVLFSCYQVSLVLKSGFLFMSTYIKTSRFWWILEFNKLFKWTYESHSKPLSRQTRSEYTKLPVTNSILSLSHFFMCRCLQFNHVFFFAIQFTLLVLYTNMTWWWYQWSNHEMCLTWKLLFL